MGGLGNRIDSADDVANGLARLVAIDPSLARLAAAHAPLPLRRKPADFASLADIVLSQVISRAAADRLLARLAEACGVIEPQAILSLSDKGAFDQPRDLGLSRAKADCLVAVARAVEDGLNLPDLANLPADLALARLTAIRGIGRWTAEVFLLGCCGHPDMFPAGDLALRRAVARHWRADDLSETAVRRLAAGWAPLRSIAARLFWADYARPLATDVPPPPPAQA